MLLFAFCVKLLWFWIEAEPEELYKRFVDSKVAAAMAAMPPDALPPRAEGDDVEEQVQGTGGDHPMGMDSNHPLWVADEDTTECADCGALW